MADRAKEHLRFLGLLTCVLEYGTVRHTVVVARALCPRTQLGWVDASTGARFGTINARATGPRGLPPARSLYGEVSVRQRNVPHRPWEPSPHEQRQE